MCIVSIVFVKYHWLPVKQGVSGVLERHLDTEEDELKIKKRMAQFMANAVTQVDVRCKEMTDKTKLFGSEALELLLFIINK